MLIFFQLFEFFVVNQTLVFKLIFYIIFVD